MKAICIKEKKGRRHFWMVRGEKGKEKQHTVNKKEIREKEKKDKEAEVRKVDIHKRKRRERKALSVRKAIISNTKREK